jgi:glycosyltransferase involved in cell wall biosynthesis
MNFENQIQQWVSIDNQLKQLNEKVKEMREKRNILEQNITNYASSNNLSNATIKIGDGRLKSHYEKRVIELDLQNNFFFRGLVESNQMPNLFACADVLLVSLKDSKIFNLTIPAKLQSYLACGKPIIGSILGNAAKLILDSKSGFVCNPSKPNELSNIVLKMSMLDEVTRVNMGKNARSYFEENFNSKILFEQLEHIMKNIIIKRKHI